MNEVRDKGIRDSEAWEERSESQTGSSAGGEQQMDAGIANTKSRLEIDKLRAEIVEIQARTIGLSAKVSRWTGVAGLIVTFLALVAGGVGLIYGYLDFRTRSEIEVDRQARQLDFIVGRNIIELSTNLSSSDTTKRANAAILLSAFEEHSVPILIANLRTHDKALADSIVRSLGLILDKPRIRDKPDLVVRPLIEEVEALFVDELQKDEPDTLTMIFFVEAFGELFAKTGNTNTLDTLDRLNDQVIEAQKDQDLKIKLENVAMIIKGVRRIVEGKTS